MKKLLVITICLSFLNSYAQNDTYEPDSRSIEYNIAYQKVFYHLLDSFRRVNGKPPLQIDSVLEASALQHSKYQDYEGEMTHIETNKNNPYYVGERVSCRNGDGENVVYGRDWLPSRTSAIVHFKLWIRSPGHRNNMLSDYCNFVGVAVYGGYATTVFGI